MPISRSEKEAIVADYVNKLNDSQGIVITEYRGLTVNRFDEIRKKMRDVGAQYTVAKKTLFRIALDQVGMSAPDELISGPIAIGFAYDNLPGTVKALLDSTKDHELLILKGAVARTAVYNRDDLKTIAELPTMDELRATLAGTVVQPAAQLLSLLVAPQRDVVSVIAAYVDKHTEGESSEDADAA
ncbi:MAG: 50S ribosomal protein L10 [Chloroflexi bacterium]|nr:50S ribosomal protein L10 [Chloroflexota bacterium]